jgi:rfaE bifunctional protein nucleotidyltransferase chain/domain
MTEDNPFHKATLSKIIEAPVQLAEVLARTYSDRKIVMVKGVYDLFHSGHYYSFINAKLYGNMLVVGVNSDAAVQKRKGNHRPIIPQKERMTLVAALSCVDWVTLYEEQSPYELLNTVKPSIFAASHFQSLTKDETEKLKGFVKFQIVPKLGRLSSTDIIKKIQTQ